MITMLKDSYFSRDSQFYYQQSLTVAGAGEAIAVPGGEMASSRLAFQLTGDGIVQVTVYPPEDILLGTAVWLDVPEGADVNPAVTAVRQINVTGTTVLNVRVK